MKEETIRNGSQETRKGLNTLAADVIKKGEALYAKLSTAQIDCIKENLENDNASGYDEVADEVEDQELSDQLRMLGLEVYSCQNNHSPMYEEVSSYIDDMEYSYDTLHSSEHENHTENGFSSAPRWFLC